MPDLVPFQFHMVAVSTITDDHDNPWFVARDVCEALGISNVSQSLTRLKSSQIRDIILNDVTGREQPHKIISESGLYKLAMKSRKKIAEEFQDWISEEVLPQIRKTGHYAVDDPVERYPQLRAIRELITATATAQLTAERAEERAHAAEIRAERAETKADIALEDLHRMTVEEFILKNGLMRQFPASSYGRISKWLADHSQRYGLRVYKAPVVGKRWDNENSYELQAFGAWLNAERHRPQQITLVKDAPPA